MRGDTTRSTFRRKKHYSGVRMQQGRVQVDADWNEQIDIQAHLQRTEGTDVIGHCGVPKKGDGYRIEITPNGEDLIVLPGRMYVDGILCEHEKGTAMPITMLTSGNEAEVPSLVIDGHEFKGNQWVEAFADGVAPRLVRIAQVTPGQKKLKFSGQVFTGSPTNPQLRRITTYFTQPNYPRAAGPDIQEEVSAKPYVVYLDVWERHISAVEDKDIREVALGGADTATRTEIVWQVKLQPLDKLPDEVKCSDFGPDWKPDEAGSTGALQARSRPGEADKAPCLVPAQAGYSRLENQLYRVDIHEGGILDGASGTSDATFKWSRDNGSIAAKWLKQKNNELTVSTIGRDSILGFAAKQWIELTDDTRELMAEPGTLVEIDKVEGQVLTISSGSGVDRNQFPRFPKVIRWDSKDALKVEVPTDNDGWIKLEDGVEIRFRPGVYNAGDYWMIPARAAVHDVLWPQDETTGEAAFEECHGIHHHYCALGLVTWHRAQGKWIIVQDCRPHFPPLTGVWAEDVHFDNSTCKISGGETVQDAIDRLCLQHGLRKHNKHLHGSGVVYGLQVNCGPDTAGELRRNVTVLEGYAIDCEGNDLILSDTVVDVLKQIEMMEGENLLTGGSGEFCLSLCLDQESMKPEISLKPYHGSGYSAQSLLAGTLLMDFYAKCIDPVVGFFKDQFHIPEGEDRSRVLVGPAWKRLITFMNLGIQMVHKKYGRYVFLSEKEDEILRTFYEELLKILGSATFCGIFDDVKAFPNYPFKEHGISTIFGKEIHRRLRIHPSGEYACAVGSGSKIDVYKLDDEELVARLDMPGGEGLVVRDVAFSDKGQQLYAIATLRDTDSIFAIADINGEEYNWQPFRVLCGVQLLTLGTAPASEHLYATGRGMGLYKIDPTIPADRVFDPELSYTFNAVGHLVIDEENGCAYATAQAKGKAPDTYSKVLELNLSARAEPAEFPLTINWDDEDIELNGRDSIAVIGAGEASHWDDISVPPGHQSLLFAVADRLEPGSDGKLLLCFDTANNSGKADVVVDLGEETDIHLGYVPHIPYLQISFEDSYRLKLLSLGVLLQAISEDKPICQLVQGYHFPVQISPLWVAHSPDAETVYILNSISNTITTTPADYLKPQAELEVGYVPGTNDFLYQLELYRTGVINAFIDVLGKSLQYLKDCLCYRFLIESTKCSKDDMEIQLARISILNNEVYQICNFAGRRYVKSFPAIEYWLSLIPFAPLVRKGIEEFCCRILPNIFSQFLLPDPEPPAQEIPHRPFVTWAAVRGGIDAIRATDFRGRASEWTGKQYELSRVVSSDWLDGVSRRTVKPQKAEIKSSDIIKRPVDEAKQKAIDANIEVSVKKYKSSDGLKYVSQSMRMPSRIPSDSRLILYEQEGVVRHWALVEEPSPIVESIQSDLGIQQKKMAEREQEVRDLQVKLQKFEDAQVNVKLQEQAEIIEAIRGDLKSQETIVKEKDQALTDLRKELKALQDRQAKFEEEVRRQNGGDSG